MLHLTAPHPPCKCLSARKQKRYVVTDLSQARCFPLLSGYMLSSGSRPLSCFIVYTKDLVLQCIFTRERDSLYIEVMKNAFKWQNNENEIKFGVTSAWSASDVCVMLCWTTVMARCQRGVESHPGILALCVCHRWVMLAQSTHQLDTFHFIARFMLWQLAWTSIYSRMRLSCGFNLQCPPPVSTVPAGCQRQLVFRTSVFIFWRVFLCQ